MLSTRTIQTFLLFAMFGCLSPQANGQEWHIEVGRNALSDELGDSLAEGAGIDVCQVEAMQASGGYRPPPGTFEFLNPDKIFNDLSGVNDINSTHAQAVGRYFYGNVMSIAPGVVNVDYYEAENFLLSALGFTTSSEPDLQAFDVQNHSWIANTGISDSIAQNLLMRMDYAINRDNLLVAAGTTNSGVTPRLMATGFNSITVGKTNGTHGVGSTNFYFSGRVKPEIVAPSPTTSRATPMVSGTAVMLRNAAAGTNAINTEATKALILAGATKSEFPDWSRTSDIPLDTTFGVGELNVYNSYKMLLAGETDGQVTPPASPSGDSGWDFGTVVPGQTLNYSIQLTEPADHLSIALTWNIEIEDTNNLPDVFVPDPTLADLNMIFAGNGLSDISNSLNHNIEHVYLTDVPAGTYSLFITGSRETDFGLAWRAATKNEAGVSDLNLVTGVNSGGGLAAVATSDDSYYEVLPGSKTANSKIGSVVEFETTSPVNMPNAIDFNIESRVNTPNVNQVVELFNFADGEYVEFESAPAPFSDTEISVSVSGELLDYIEPATGLIRARVTWVPTGPVLQFPWTARVDQAGFTVSQ